MRIKTSRAAKIGWEEPSRFRREVGTMTSIRGFRSPLFIFRKLSPDQRGAFVKEPASLLDGSLRAEAASRRVADGGFAESEGPDGFGFGGVHGGCGVVECWSGGVLEQWICGLMDSWICGFKGRWVGCW